MIKPSFTTKLWFTFSSYLSSVATSVAFFSCYFHSSPLPYLGGSEFRHSSFRVSSSSKRQVSIFFFLLLCQRESMSFGLSLALLSFTCSVSALFSLVLCRVQFSEAKSSYFVCKSMDSFKDTALKASSSSTVIFSCGFYAVFLKPPLHYHLFSLHMLMAQRQLKENSSSSFSANVSFQLCSLLANSCFKMTTSFELHLLKHNQISPSGNHPGRAACC